ALEPRDIADRAQCRTADLAHSLRNVVGDGEDLLGLLVEHQMIVAEMRATDMPMEILRLEIKREDIGKQRIKRAADVASGIVAKVGRGRERRLAAFFDCPILVHGEFSWAANAGTTRLSSRRLLGVFCACSFEFAANTLD